VSFPFFDIGSVWPTIILLIQAGGFVFDNGTRK
jgi:hypothetical protein